MKTLWSDVTGTRHFLIPDGQQLPSGEFILRTVTGRQQRVDPNVLASFEVTREEAKIWLQEQFGQVVEQAKGAVMDMLRGGQTPPPDFEAPSSEQPASAKNEAPGPDSSPGMALFSALSGESVENLKSDTPSLLRGIHKLVTELGEIFEEAIASDDAQWESARQKVRELRSVFLQHGLRLSERMVEIPDWLREWVEAAEDRGNGADVAAQLEALAQEFEDVAAAAARHLRALAERLRTTRVGAEGSEESAPCAAGSPSARPSTDE